MAVKNITYSRNFTSTDITFTFDDCKNLEDVTIRGEIRERFAYKENVKRMPGEKYEAEGEDGTQKYCFRFWCSNPDKGGQYTSIVKIKKCGDEKVIQNECDLEKFLKKAGFVPKTSE